MSRKNKRASNKINGNKERAPTQTAPFSFTNAGYGDTSASSQKTSMAGWLAPPSSPDSDILAHLPTLRGRARNLKQGGAPIAGAAINTSRVNVIGPGLRLSAAPDRYLLGLDTKAAKEWARKTEREFELWANSLSCDALRMNNFYDLQDIIFTGYLDNGDGWAVFKYKKPTPHMPYSLRIHVFEADRVRNPNEIQGVFGPVFSVNDINPKNKNRIVSGVEIDQEGMIVAYWIANTYAYDPAKSLNPVQVEFKRVEAFGGVTGLPNVLQVKHDDRAEQYRGTPFLAPVIETIKQTGRYTNAELTSAIVKAFLTVFITHPIGSNNNSFSLEQTAPPWARIDPSKFQVGPGNINDLPPGSDIKAVDGGRATSAFEPFMRELVKGIGANLNIPYEVLMKNFQSSYSASRAALLQAWQAFRTMRVWFVRDFCEPVYLRWLAEAVAIGRIEAPGFFDDPLIRNAWAKASWYGPVPGQIDPVKEVKASALKVAYGFSTPDKETQELGGGDFDDNIEANAASFGTMQEIGLDPQTFVSNAIKNTGGESDATVDRQQ